jgi:hypothetical protein
MTGWQWLGVLAGAALVPGLFGVLAVWLHTCDVNRLIAKMNIQTGEGIRHMREQTEERIRCVHAVTQAALERMEARARRP